MDGKFVFFSIHCPSRVLHHYICLACSIVFQFQEPQSLDICSVSTSCNLVLNCEGEVQDFQPLSTLNRIVSAHGDSPNIVLIYWISKRGIDSWTRNMPQTRTLAVKETHPPSNIPAEETRSRGLCQIMACTSISLPLFRCLDPILCR